MDRTQRGVLVGMALAVVTAVIAFVCAMNFLPPDWCVDYELASRLRLASGACLIAASTLLFCIARLAKHRFFTPADIHGSALTQGTDRARLLQSLLQNTLEQFCLATPIYFATSILGSTAMLPTIPVASFLFVIGRVCFFIGYEKGAPARAYGFALTFYPTVMLLMLLMI